MTTGVGARSCTNPYSMVFKRIPAFTHAQPKLHMIAGAATCGNATPCRHRRSDMHKHVPICSLAPKHAYLNASPYNLQQVSCIQTNTNTIPNRRRSWDMHRRQSISSPSAWSCAALCPTALACLTRLAACWPPGLPGLPGLHGQPGQPGLPGPA